MFDNVAINIAIGLVLIYLLYSLLVTIVGEMIATWLGIRARILRMAIDRMLNDGYYKEKSQKYPSGPRKKGGEIYVQSDSFLGKFLLREPAAFKTSFAGRFYAYPSIKYLTRLEEDQKYLFSQTKPSYISAENFALTLINMLADKGVGNNKWDQVNSCVRLNSLNIQPETAKHLTSILVNSGGDINTFRDNLMKWFEDTMDRANGWYKKKLSLILFWFGFLLAIAFNVDSIGITRMLSNDKVARGQLVDMGVALAKDSVRYKGIINNKPDSIIAKSIIDTGFSRVTRDLGQANMILGLGWDFKKMSKPKSYVLDKADDNKLFSTIAALTKKYPRIQSDRDSLRLAQYEDLKKVDSVRKAVICWQFDTSIQKDNPQKTVENIRTIQKIDSGKKSLLSVSAKYAKDSFLLAINIGELNNIHRWADSLTGQSFKSIDSLTVDTLHSRISILGTREYNTFEKLLHIVGETTKPLRLLGFVITALALSLGAPFWFDLLGKLVALRGSGVKPEEKKPTPGSLDSNVPVRMPASTPTTAVGTIVAGDVMDKALALYGNSIKNTAGVKSIFKVPDNKNKSWLLQINVSDDTVKNAIKSQYAKIKVDGITVKPKIVVSGIPENHVNNAGQISNASGLNGFGSLGCIIVNTETQERHILSCWHVMKGNINYDDTDTETTILDAPGYRIASRWAGGILESLDYAFAQLFQERMNEDNQALFASLGIIKPRNYRVLSNADVLNQIDIKYFDTISGKLMKGVIFTQTDNAEILYDDKVRIVSDLLILTANINNQSPISQGGNSGAVVFDNDGSPVAMIIAGDKRYTYAVKLSNIFTIHTEMKILN